MGNLVFSGHNRTYDDFKKQLAPEIKPLFDSLRDYCFSLGKNVIEDVRMHRIVFCKSMTFRFFADMEPQQDSILIKIRRDRKESQKEVQIKHGQDLNEIKNLLCDAYNTIHQYKISNFENSPLYCSVIICISSTIAFVGPR